MRKQNIWIRYNIHKIKWIVQKTDTYDDNWVTHPICCDDTGANVWWLSGWICDDESYRQVDTSTFTAIVPARHAWPSLQSSMVVDLLPIIYSTPPAIALITSCVMILLRLCESLFERIHVRFLRFTKSKTRLGNFFYAFWNVMNMTKNV